MQSEKGAKCPNLGFCPESSLHEEKKLSPVAPEHCLWWRLTKSLCTHLAKHPSPRMSSSKATVTLETPTLNMIR